MRLPRKGFSLLELIVVITIVSVALALSACAIQKVRGVAALLSCANNLRQQGLALHQYHDANRLLPRGVSHPVLRPPLPQLYGPDDDPYPLLNWQARLLPYLDQAGLWEQTHRAFEVDRYILNSPPHSGMLVPVAVYVCPADGRREPPGKSKGGEFRAPTGYLGVEGVHHFLQDGVLFLDSAVRFADITDGLSNTLAVGERPPSRTFEYGRWYGGWGLWGSFNNIMGVRETGTIGLEPSCPDGPHEFGPGSLHDPCSSFRYWSMHPGGGNWLFADGSVRFMAYSGRAILPALATRAGGEALPVGY